jgi:hypothetical protein
VFRPGQGYCRNGQRNRKPLATFVNLLLPRGI